MEKMDEFVSAEDAGEREPMEEDEEEADRGDEAVGEVNAEADAVDANPAAVRDGGFEAGSCGAS